MINCTHISIGTKESSAISGCNFYQSRHPTISITSEVRYMNSKDKKSVFHFKTITASKMFAFKHIRFTILKVIPPGIQCSSWTAISILADSYRKIHVRSSSIWFTGCCSKNVIHWMVFINGRTKCMNVYRAIDVTPMCNESFTQLKTQENALSIVEIIKLSLHMVTWLYCVFYVLASPVLFGLQDVKVIQQLDCLHLANQLCLLNKVAILR